MKIQSECDLRHQEMNRYVNNLVSLLENKIKELTYRIEDLSNYQLTIGYAQAGILNELNELKERFENEKTTVTEVNES